LVIGGEFVVDGLDVAFKVLSDGHHEQWVVSEDAGAALDGLEREATVAFVGNCTDLVVLVGCLALLASSHRQRDEPLPGARGILVAVSIMALLLFWTMVVEVPKVSPEV
jgi:hypothetical protein